MAGALWQHDRYVRPCHAVISNMKDADGDGLDEIVLARTGVTEALTHDGKVLWREARKNHSNNVAFGDLDGDDRAKVIRTHEQTKVGLGERG